MIRRRHAWREASVLVVSRARSSSRLRPRRRSACIPSAYATPSSSPHTPHTHYRLPHSSPLQLERPATAETRSSCLRAAIARQALICRSDLVGGIPGPFLEISIALFQPSTSTYVATSLYDRSDCSDASSD
jgi:hypothetical protein